MDTPLIKVGIMEGQEIFFTLEGNFKLEKTNAILTGKCKAIKSELGICLKWTGEGFFELDELLLDPVDPEKDKFELHDVTIGINFHWERKENQIFKGSLHVISDGEILYAINTLSIEDYLISVISSEMSATSSLELLKAHAVISSSLLSMLSSISWISLMRNFSSAEVTLIAFGSRFMELEKSCRSFIRWLIRFLILACNSWGLNGLVM